MAFRLNLVYPDVKSPLHFESHRALGIFEPKHAVTACPAPMAAAPPPCVSSASCITELPSELTSAACFSASWLALLGVGGTCSRASLAGGREQPPARLVWEQVPQSRASNQAEVQAQQKSYFPQKVVMTEQFVSDHWHDHDMALAVNSNAAPSWCPRLHSIPLQSGPEFLAGCCSTPPSCLIEQVPEAGKHNGLGLQPRLAALITHALEALPLCHVSQPIAGLLAVQLLMTYASPQAASGVSMQPTSASASTGLPKCSCGTM